MLRKPDAKRSRRQILTGFASSIVPAHAEYPDIRSVAADLITPPVSPGEPGAARRVRQTLAEYKSSEVHHTLYLPQDWRRGRKYPVIVEYAGNGNYRNEYGDVSEGTVEGSNLGYGISGGKRFIWVCLPYVDPKAGKNAVLWWGDAEATVDYCKKGVAEVCARFGGDPRSVILSGFSRGAIACNYIGLREESIARLWLAFLPYSHYDGVRKWPYPDSDRGSAFKRLERLKGRAQFIVQENSVEATREYLHATGIRAPFTFLTLPFRNHNDAWALRDIPARRMARRWLKETLRRRPGAEGNSGAEV